ncbi:MAG: type II secretion system F family protein [bacterium]|nr:type II secretion system F family protein [bacterium]
MPALYKYEALAQDGSHQKGTITAPEAAAVEDFLRGQELLPISISAIKDRRQISMFGFLKGADYENLIMFTNSLATMHRAGIPLLRALAVIRVGRADGRFNYAIDRLRVEVQSGKQLSEGMSDIGDVFSGVYVSCVAAGEESGSLENTLDELAVMLEQEMELTRQIKSGIRYPAMVIGAIVAAFFVIMNFVVPRFVTFYSGFDTELPLPTRIIMGMSDFFSSYWPVMLVLLIVAGFGFKKLLNNEHGRLWFDRQLLRIPIIGNLIIKGNVARFSLMFRILTTSGLPIVKSVMMLAATVKNTAIGLEIRKLGELFRQGRDIDVESGDFEYFPEQALHMLGIGLESGNLDVMLREVGDHYSKQVMYTSRQLTAIIEPILTLVMGFFVLVLALAIFLPMWNLIKVFQG